MGKLLLLLSILCLAHNSRQDLIVETAKGLIQGVEAEDGNYTMFLGVPYGVVDADNPFGDAQAAPDFNTTFEATTDPVVCPQISSTTGNATGSLDCLNLNIYVPNTANLTDKLPVMVYIHGGAFMVGSGNRDLFGPKYLMKHDVIIVSANYRLGPYGFLCLDIPDIDNQGLKDQKLALEWVKDNIESFGGDPDTITAFGQSAGSMSLDFHLLTSQGLFKRVILQSGTALTPWTLAKINNTIPINIAKGLGYETDNVTEAIDYLKTADVLDVITIATEIQDGNYLGLPSTMPCIDKTGSGAFLTSHPANLSPKVEGMDVMIGHTFREVSNIYPATEEFYANYSFGNELIRYFDEVLDEDDVRHFYIGDNTPSIDFRKEIVDFGSDFAFVSPLARSVTRYLQQNATNVYWYMFAYEGNRSYKVGLTPEESAHSDDLSYLLTLAKYPEDPDEADQNMIDVMTKMWTDFAKYGTPTPSVTDLVPVVVPPVKGEERPYLVINSTLSIEHRAFNQRVLFWDLYYKLNGDKISGINL